MYLSVCLNVGENMCVFSECRHNPHFSFNIADQKKRKLRKMNERNGTLINKRRKK